MVIQQVVGGEVGVVRGSCWYVESQGFHLAFKAGWQALVEVGLYMTGFPWFQAARVSQPGLRITLQLARVSLW